MKEKEQRRLRRKEARKQKALDQQKKKLEREEAKRKQAEVQATKRSVRGKFVFFPRWCVCALVLMHAH